MSNPVPMEYFVAVRSEFLNHYGYLFGGYMLKWVDDFAYITAMREFPLNRFVTRAMDSAVFSRSVRNGALLKFTVSRLRLGTTSVTYEVTVEARYMQEESVETVFGIHVTMNAIDESGRKTPLPR